MKRLFFFLVAFPVFALKAQTSNPGKGINGKTLPTVEVTEKHDRKAEWYNCLASQIPLKGRLPYYDTMVKYKGDFTREDMDHNAEYYFKKLFSSRNLKLESDKHSYTGYGAYVFSSDKRNASPNLYKVYYTVEITVKGGHYSIDMHDFKLENQHNEVSFVHLMDMAKNDNDSKAKEILAQFHTNNEYEMKRIHSAMSSKENLARVTASAW